MQIQNGTYKFKLFLIKKNRKSELLISELKKLLEKNYTINYELEIIDILENPDITLQNNILASPTLIKETPPPQKRIVGSILNNEKLLADIER